LETLSSYRKPYTNGVKSKFFPKLRGVIEVEARLSAKINLHSCETLPARFPAQEECSELVFCSQSSVFIIFFRNKNLKRRITKQGFAFVHF